MIGKNKAFEAEIERDIALAWHITNFSRAGKKFRDLRHYLPSMQPKAAQTATEVAAIFQTFAARGLVKIREVPKNGA